MRTPVYSLNLMHSREVADKMGFMAIGLLGNKMRPRGVEYATAQMLLNINYVT